MVCCTVENERLSWELEQMRDLVDMQELARLRLDLDSLRNQILLMADREDTAQVTLPHCTLPLPSWALCPSWHLNNVLLYRCCAFVKNI